MREPVQLTLPFYTPYSVPMEIELVVEPIDPALTVGALIVRTEHIGAAMAPVAEALTPFQAFTQHVDAHAAALRH